MLAVLFMRMPATITIIYNRHLAFTKATCGRATIWIWTLVEPGSQHSTEGSSPIGEDGMNCHATNHDPEQADGRDNNKGGRHGHLLMMILCCGLPLLFIALLPLLRGIGGGWLDKVARYSDRKSVV